MKMRNHKNVSKNLVELVETFPHLKENYNSLIGYYWVMFDNVRTVEDYARATPAETITRNFRKLVKVGKIILPKHVQEARREKEKEFRHEFTQIS